MACRTDVQCALLELLYSQSGEDKQAVVTHAVSVCLAALRLLSGTGRGRGSGKQGRNTRCLLVFQALRLMASVEGAAEGKARAWERWVLGDGRPRPVFHPKAFL